MKLAISMGLLCVVVGCGADDGGVAGPELTGSGGAHADAGAWPDANPKPGTKADAGKPDSGKVDAGSAGSSNVGGGANDCDTLGYEGMCTGDVLTWCEEGEKKVVDCADTDRECKWQDESVGYNCVSTGGGFGYPVGDKSTYPAGGWQVSQVLGNYLYSPPFVGGHLAEDIFDPNGASANSPVYSVADGVVAFAGSNTSSYKNVVMIEHDLGNGQKVCSFYGHLWPPVVSTGQTVKRGQKIAEVMDWVYFYGVENSHLHYVLVTEELCQQALAGSGGLCGYDSTSAPSGISNLSNEPASYTSAGDPCGSQIHENGYLAPSQFIQKHHF